MEEILRRQNSLKCLHVSPVSLLGVSAGYFQRALLDEAALIRTQMGKAQLISNGLSAWDALCDTTP
jgi:hypothetical protein